jgi:methionine-rich copper-binding protein CopC
VIRLKFSSWISASAQVIVAATLPTIASAHAFPIRSEPRVGWTVAVSPPKVTIWFDGELEPAFSTIAVYNAAKQRMDKGNGRVNPSNATILEVELPALSPGRYHVYWKVLSKDTHVTEGDFSFAVEKK